MSAKFNFIPVSSQFVDSEEKLIKIAGNYFEALNKSGGERCNEENLSYSKPLFYFIVTGGTERLLLNLHKKRSQNNPNELVYLLAHPTHNSLPASMEILARLQQLGIKGRILYLNNHNDVKGFEKIGTAVKDFDVMSSLQNSRIGLVGEPSDWLVASSPKLKTVKKVWGSEVVPVDIKEITKVIQNISSDDISAVLNFLESEAGEIKEPSKLDLENNVKVYLALKEIIKKYDLNALTIRCFDLVLDIKTTGCFGLAQLNDDGYIAGCEGDLISTIGMVWVNKLLDQIPWMANPAQVDEEKNTLWLAHCTVPRSIVTNYNLRSHFESGIGVGIQGTFSKNPVTLLRLGGKKLKKIWLAEGEIIQNGNSEHLCRTQIEIKLTNGKVQQLLNTPLGNHLILINGHNADRLKDWWELMIK